MGFPPGKELAHQGFEAPIVGRFQEVDQFMDDHVLKAFSGLFGEARVEPDIPGFGTAAPPPGPHVPNGDPVRFDVQDRLPFGD